MDGDYKEALAFIKAQEARREASYQAADERIRDMRKVQDIRGALRSEDMFTGRIR
jgi:hypothetical protein